MASLLGPIKWFYHEFGVASIRETGSNAWLIIFARACRMFAYGTNVFLAMFFSSLEFSDHQIGIFMTLTMLGDVFLGTFLTLVADKLGRRKVLLAGSFLMILSGVVFAVFENFWILLLAAVAGVISVTGGDFGPFRSIEESILSQLTTPTTRSDVLSWYVTTATLGSALGSAACGKIIRTLEGRDGWKTVDAYHALFWVYAIMGVVNAALMLLLTKDCELHNENEAYTQLPQSEAQRVVGAPTDSGLPSPELPEPPKRYWFIRVATWLSTRLSQISAPTRSVMYKVWFLLAVDSVADGMSPYAFANYFMDLRFHPDKATLGYVTSVAYFLGAVSSVFAGPLVRRIGLINTMVFTHLPSSLAVLVFPFPLWFWLCIILLLIRAALNNMDQAPRTAFIAAVVKPEERTAVMGITANIRTLAGMSGPVITGALAAGNRFWIAFVVAGSCRVAYDLGLYAMFVNMRLHQHEQGAEESVGSSGSDGRRELDEEEVLEMASLASSDSGFGDDDAVEMKVPLDVPKQHERLRSRSPHRPSSSDS